MSRYLLLPNKKIQFYRGNLFLHTHNGYGATSTAIPRYTTAAENTITRWATYADDANLGTTITILEAGLYAGNITSASAVTTAAATGFSLNSNQLSTSILSITVTMQLCKTLNGAPGASVTLPNASFIRWLAVGDVVRPHNDAHVPATAANCIMNFCRML